MPEYALVGKRVPRTDSIEKVRGEAKFTADLSLPGMLHGKVLRSPHPHARILSIDTSKAEREFGFRAETSFKEGLRKTIDWYLEQRRQGTIK